MWSALYPGQGSQFPGMGKFLFENFKVAQELFEESSDTLSLDMKKLCFEDPDSQLNLTQNTQPALLLVSTATYQVLVSEIGSLDFKCAAGHSVGEYAAVVNSGAMSFVDGIRAVRKRGEYMQSAVPVGEGGMLALMGLTRKQVDYLCDWAQEQTGLSPVEPANDNAPGQIVISGKQELIKWIAKNAKADIFDEPPKRLRAIPLKVSAPFHCSMMKPAEENMKSVLNDIPFSKPSYPIIQNTVAAAIDDNNELRENLIKQISSPVRWVESINELNKLGVNKCIEVGCGKVISGLVKKIDPENLKTFNVNSLDDIKELVATV